MQKHLTTQHAQQERIHECHVFDMLLNDGGHSQSAASENLMKVDKRIDKMMRFICV